MGLKMINLYFALSHFIKEFCFLIYIQDKLFVYQALVKIIIKNQITVDFIKLYFNLLIIP